MSSFKVGQKCVCIESFRNQKNDFKYGVRVPVKGEIYTIRKLMFREGEIYLMFEELINPELVYDDAFGEAGFWDKKFRYLDYQFAQDTIAYVIKKVKEEAFELAN